MPTPISNDRKHLEWLLILVIWAGIYLPGLGSLELRGEEGRRILPAVTMLETGNWLVPYVGGEPYLRKPPMVNWLVAGSFKLTGQQNEWAARLPSVIGILWLALVMYSSLRSWIGREAAFFGSIALLTTAEIIDKGRLIEIDGLYVAAFGLGLVTWIAHFNGSAWRRWLLPAVPLGIGLLLKGPLHLLFFYGIVVATLWRARRLRELISPAHLLGLLIMVAIFAAWAIPHLHSAEARSATKTWSNQFAERLDFTQIHWKDWLLNFPRSLFNFLPWILFLPFGRKPALKDEPLIRGLEIGAFVTFLLVTLVPGSLPRYSLPIAVPICILAAYRMKQSEPFLKPWKYVLFGLGCFFLACIVVGSFIGANRWCVIPAGMMSLALLVYFNFEDELSVRKMTLATASLVIAGILIYCGIVLPRLQKHEVLRPRAQAMAKQVPPGNPIYAVDPGSQQVLFYLRQPWFYVPKGQEIPVQAKFLLIPAHEISTIERAHPGRVKRLLAYKDKGGKRSLLVELN